MFLAEELSDDESFVLFAGLVVTLISAAFWLLRLTRTTTLGRDPAWRAPLFFCPPACLFLLLLPVLNTWTDAQVRNDNRYIVLFLFLGVVVLSAVALGLSILGLRATQDAIESANPAAIIVVCAAQLSATLIYAGSNIGAGDTIWTTIGPAVLGLVTMFLLWLIVELTTDISESIAIDRDAASALRFGGFLIAVGAILGRALAGNYVSADATVHDFATHGWPALPLAILLIAVQRALRPTPAMPRPAIALHGLLVALLFLLTGTLWVLHLGWWH